MAGNSCKMCPSYMTDEVAIRQRFGKPMGSIPMCGRFGHVLGTNRDTEEQRDVHAEVTAAPCSGFGEPLPAEPETVTPVVIMDKKDSTVRASADINSCAACEHYLNFEPMNDQLGIPLPLCRVKGTLIFKPVRECKGCPWASEGPKSDSMADVHDRLLQRFNPDFKPSRDHIVAAALVRTHSDTDPRLYKSDRVVDPEDASDGIRAWRRLDPSGDALEVAWAPIFDWDLFSDDDKKLIPVTGGQGNPELYVDYHDPGLLYQFFVEGYNLDETPVYVGPPGVGKTQAMRVLAWQSVMPFIRMQNDSDMDPDAVLGTPGYDPQRGTYFDPGIFPTWWQKVCVICDDEPNVAPESIWQVKRPLTDNSKELRIGNFVFPRNDYCFYAMCMNPSHDPRNVGTRELADADTSRLSFIGVEEPPPEIEAHIIKSYCKSLDDFDISDELVELVVRVGADIREMAKNQEIPFTWGTRNQIKVARKLRWYRPALAYKNAALNNMEESTAELILQAIASHTPGGGAQQTGNRARTPKVNPF